MYSKIFQFLERSCSLLLIDILFKYDMYLKIYEYLKVAICYIICENYAESQFA